MSKNQIKKQIPDKALMLLPWYVTGWLSPEEHDYIHGIISQFPEYEELLAVERKVIGVLKQDKSILEHSCLNSTEERLAGVLERLPARDNELQKDTKNSASIKSSSVLESMSKVLSGFSTQFQYAVFASMTALVVGLSVAFVAPLVIEQDAVFYPANTTSALIEKKSDHTILLVGVNSNVSQAQLLKLLNDTSATIDPANGKNGMYRIHLSDKLAPDQTKILLNKLIDNEELFWFAGEEF